MAVTLIDTDLLNRLVDRIAEEFNYPHDKRAQALVARAQEYLDGPVFDEAGDGDLWMVDRYHVLVSYVRAPDEDEAVDIVSKRDEELYGPDGLIDYSITETDGERVD